MVAIARARLLGRFALQVDGWETASLRSARAESLTGLLLLHRGEPQARQRLAGLLWPDSDAGQARTNLRHLLHTLRHDLPGADEYLHITARTVCWRAAPPLELDVAVFERLLDADAPDAVQRRNALRAAVARYGGELLEGCEDEWLWEERERLRRRYLEALVELADLCEAAGELGEAATSAERLLQHDPLREDAHRLLIRVHGARADRAGAVRAYHRCASTLERELGVEPSPSTRKTYLDLLATGTDSTQADRPDGRPVLIGRQAEQKVLADVWRTVAAGSAHLVLFTGEAGVGKTRLVEELFRWCARRGATAVEARCYLAEGPLAYGPVADWLRHPTLRPTLAALDQARLTELARIVPELLEEIPGLPPPRPVPEHEHRHRLFDAVTAAVLATTRPVLLVLDDLPYADRETCQLVHYLLRARSHARLLITATARTEDLDAPHLHELLDGARLHNRLTEIVLERLTRQETATLAERLTGSWQAADEAEQLYQDTEGNPLFVIEAIRAGRSSGDGLTPRVQSVIATRLARLGPQARGVLALAAAIGREFTPDVLAAAADLDEDALVYGLDELWRRRIVRERDGGAYDFTHDRIRQVAYAGVGPARRRRVHARIARGLERIHAQAPGSVSAQIAAHHERSGATAEAIAWYHRAAEAAEALHANARSLELLKRALSLLDALPPSRERDARELELQVATLVPLLPLEGYTSTGMTAALDRAQQLVSQLGMAPSAPLVRSLALEALTRSDFARATHYGALLQETAERSSDDVLAVEAAYVLGIAAFWQAELEHARCYFKTAIALYRPQNRTEHLAHYGQDPRVVCLGRLACTYWFLGRPTDALRAHREALAWAAEIGHPFSRAVALTFGITLAIDRGDEAEVRRLVREFATTTGGGMHTYVLDGFLGYVRVLDGDTDAGLSAISTALHRAATAPLAPGQHAMMQRLQLGAFLAARDRDGALAAANRLLRMGGPARLWAPLARRVRAELLSDGGGGTRVERAWNGA